MARAHCIRIGRAGSVGLYRTLVLPAEAGGDGGVIAKGHPLGVGPAAAVAGEADPCAVGSFGDPRLGVDAQLLQRSRPRAFHNDIGTGEQRSEVRNAGGCAPVQRHTVLAGVQPVEEVDVAVARAIRAILPQEIDTYDPYDEEVRLWRA